MKKIIIGIFIYFLSVSYVFGVSYENILVALENKDKGKITDLTHEYMTDFEGFLDCRAYNVLSEVLDEQEHNIVYKNGYEVCLKLKKGKIKEANTLIKNLELKNYKNYDNYYSFYLYMNMLMVSYEIPNISFIENITKMTSRSYKNDKGKIFFDLHQEGFELLSSNYLKEGKVEDYFKMLESMDLDYPTYTSNSNFTYHKFGKLFFLLRDDKNIGKYKNGIIKKYGEDYYTFLYKYANIRNLLMGEGELNIDSVIADKKHLIDYYTSNRKEIDEGFGYGNYDFKEDFTDPLNNYIENPNTTRINNSNTTGPNNLISKNSEITDLASSSEVDDKKNQKISSSKDSIKKNYIYILFFIFFILILLILFLKNKRK